MLIPMDWFMALIGGAVIGLAVSILLYFNGRVTGISGIVFNGLFKFSPNDLWRLLFVAGLLLGGAVMVAALPEHFVNTLTPSRTRLATAGLFVGFGTVLGSGCTSGHGVCGISRLSIRSILATMTFMAFGVVAVALMSSLGGL